VSPKLRKQIACELEQLEHLLETARPLLVVRGEVDPELAHLWAVGAVLQSFYSGVENIFKRIVLEAGGELPSGGAWHTELLESMGRATPGRREVLSEELLNRLREYLDFRHVFRSAYVFVLRWDRMAPLVRDCEETFRLLEQELKGFVRKLAGEM